MPSPAQLSSNHERHTPKAPTAQVYMNNNLSDPPNTKAHLNSQHFSRKPIYDDPSRSSSNRYTSRHRQPHQDSTTSTPSSPPDPAGFPTYTDELSRHIRTMRLHLHGYSARAEGSLNKLMSRAFSLEHDFTSTVASLAPPRSANEPLIPGFIYISVATLAGSIVTRSRGIVLRAFVPGAFGLATAYAVLPVTMANVEELVGRYEERYPNVRETHLQVRERAERFWETGKAHAGMTLQMGEGKLEEAREKVREWVRKGK